MSYIMQEFDNGLGKRFMPAQEYSHHYNYVVNTGTSNSLLNSKLEKINTQTEVKSPMNPHYDSAFEHHS